MPVLVYLHGFLSSPQSIKAQQTEAWLKAHHPDVRYLCPFLSSHPTEARAALDQLMVDLEGEQVGLIGSSLGGFWATYLVEEHDVRAVLVNPAVRPQAWFVKFEGKPLKNYHSDHTYCLTGRDLQTLKAADSSEIRRPGNYWVMLQTGDETLDYRHAQEKYAQSKMLIEEGGNHTFEGYEAWLPQVVEFLFRR
jgi:predicted esterase YcpF (UPF0227 family)